MYPQHLQDSTSSVPAHFAKAVLNGEFDSQPVFMGMVQAMVQKKYCEKCGVGMQNFHYELSFDQFASMVALTSPKLLPYL